MYHAIDAGVSSYNATVEEARRAQDVIDTLDQVRALGHSLTSAAGKAAEMIVCIGLRNITSRALTSTSIPAIVLGTAMNVVATKLIVDPIIGAATGALNQQGAIKGFVQGMERSTFGLLSLQERQSQQQVVLQAVQVPQAADMARPVAQDPNDTIAARVMQRRREPTHQGQGLRRINRGQDGADANIGRR